MFDGVVGASSFSGDKEFESAGAIHAENEVLAFLAGLAGLPAGAGGCFVSGGSAGNLSAPAVARAGGPHVMTGAVGGGATWMAVADTVHSSVANVLDLLGVRALVVPTGPDGVLTGAALRAALEEHVRPVRAVIASAGSTNAGVVDDLAAASLACSK